MTITIEGSIREPTRDKELEAMNKHDSVSQLVMGTPDHRLSLLYISSPWTGNNIEKKENKQTRSTCTNTSEAHLLFPSSHYVMKKKKKLAQAHP